MKLKLLLLCFSLLFLTSCDDKGEAYTSPKTDLSAETYEAVIKGDTCQYYWSTPQTIYLDIDGSIYKTVIVSESDLIVKSGGELLLMYLVLFVVGLLLGWVLNR